MRSRLLAAVAIVLGQGCRPSPPPDPVQPAAAMAAPPRQRERRMPRPQAELPTTDGGLAASTFLGLYDLAVATEHAAPKKKPPAALVSLLLTHAQYFGQLDDYERALRLAERAVRMSPDSADALLQRASARQALHLFARALDDLERAAQLGGDRDTVDAARAGILQALGREDEALAIRERLRDKRATTGTLAAVAQLLGALGRTREAESLFVDAQDAFADVSPFPLAWLYFQAGLLEERAGRPSAARDLYQAAHDRLPIYAPATGHLATSLALAGDARAAIALLEPLVRTSDDPEYEAQLGVLLRSAGEEARARDLVTRAGLRYDALVRRWPEAFSDHAARFWLAAGANPQRALLLARRNLSARRTVDAYDLAIEAALAARSPVVACAWATESLRLPHVTAALHLRASRAFASCGRADRADRELALSY